MVSRKVCFHVSLYEIAELVIQLQDRLGNTKKFWGRRA
jgi:hypothetical protein